MDDRCENNIKRSDRLKQEVCKKHTVSLRTQMLNSPMIIEVKSPQIRCLCALEGVISTEVDNYTTHKI